MTTPTTSKEQHDHIAERVLERIKDERLSPRPRWEFIFKNYFFWTFGALAVAFGSLAFSATLFEITNVDWRLSVATHSNFFSFFLAAAPFLWVFMLALFILIGYVTVRRTNHGYRYPLVLIALGAVMTSITVGSGLYTIGLGRATDEMIGDHPPFYRPILFAERSWWLAPEKGLLGGQIVDVSPDISSFTLRDFSGQVWHIDSSDLRNQDLATVARAGTVRVVGLPSKTATTSFDFHACFVFPWETRGDFRNESLPPPLAVFSTTSERGEKNSTTTQGEACEGIRPYRQLRTIDDANP